MEVLKNLTTLILSHNLFKVIDHQFILKTIPQIEVLDLSHNKIEDIDSLIELGKLEKLKILDLSGNKVCTYLSRFNMLQMLLYPKKYDKYDPVKVLTAGYNAIPNPRYFK